MIGLDCHHLEKLNDYIETGLNLHHFNPNFALSSFDFDKYSCYYIPKIMMDISVITKFNKELELEDNSNHSDIKK